MALLEVSNLGIAFGGLQAVRVGHRARGLGGGNLLAQLKEVAGLGHHRIVAVHEQVFGGAGAGSGRIGGGGGRAGGQAGGGRQGHK